MSVEKFYKKVGNHNYKERKLIQIINKTIEENPEKKKLIREVYNLQDLQKLSIDIQSDDAVIVPEDNIPAVETPTEPVIEKTKQTPDIMAETPTESTNRPVAKPDPFNRAEPVVRDYVLDDKFDANNAAKTSNTTIFAEPTNFDEAFSLPNLDNPDSEDEGEQVVEHHQAQRSSNSNEGRGSRSQSSGSNDLGGGTSHSRNDYSAHDEPQSDAKAKRRSKRFAKSVVDMVCSLSELGFIWWTSKEINENKLAEYELSGEYDLQALLTLEEGTEITVKQFFQNQLGMIQEAAVISKEERDDLADALAEVFIEENIQPSPKWDLAFSVLTVLGKKAMIGYSIVQQQKAVLEQLRVRKEEHIQPTQSYQQPVQEPMQQQQRPAPVPTNEPVYSPTPSTSTIHASLEDELNSDMALMDTLTSSGIATKE